MRTPATRESMPAATSAREDASEARASLPNSRRVITQFSHVVQAFRPAGTGGPEGPHYACYLGSVNAYNVSPAPTTTYWRPSSRYVSGPLLLFAPRPTCHNGLPVAGS